MTIDWLPVIDPAAIVVIGAVCVLLMLVSGWYENRHQRR